MNHCVLKADFALAMVLTILDVRLPGYNDLYARKRSTSNVCPTNKNSVELSGLHIRKWCVWLGIFHAYEMAEISPYI